MSNAYLYIQSTSANWVNPDQKTNAHLGENHLWRIKVSDFSAGSESFKLLLDAAELEKILRYKSIADQQTRIISRAVLKILLGRYLQVEPQEISFELNLQKKPILKNANFKPIHFNVSHSGDWILIGISSSPIGVDLEKADASFTYQNLLDFSFSLNEKKHIQAAENPQQTFYKLWTRKEAFLKATGKGLIDELNAVPSLDGVHQNPGELTGSIESWQITSFTLNENHICSAAFIPVKTVLHFFNFQL